MPVAPQCNQNASALIYALTMYFSHALIGLDVTFTPPGAAGSGTNPEQLFAAGWSACLISAMKIAAGKMKVALPADLAIDAEVDVGTTHDAYGLAARLNVSLPGMEREVAQRLVEATDQLCPYSNATRGNIDVAINLV